MNKLLLLPVLLTGLSACGGGSSTSPESLPPLSSSSSNTTTTTPTTMFKTLVIDGYVEGANVFIDFNFNLIQDEGEPSGIFNNTTYEYEFNSTDFKSPTLLRRVVRIDQELPKYQ